MAGILGKGGGPWSGLATGMVGMLSESRFFDSYFGKGDTLL
jgi:hypothetical protein